MNLAEINALNPQAFESAFADVAEHSPWVAAQAEQARPFASREAMVAAFAEAVMAAPEPEQLALLKAHPDLATRLHLTADSTLEQADAGLGTLTPEEFDVFTAHNEAYKAENGFPFIFAVKGATKEQILKAFEERHSNSVSQEFETALEQVCRIIRFRLENRVDP